MLIELGEETIFVSKSMKYQGIKNGIRYAISIANQNNT